MIFEDDVRGYFRFVERPTVFEPKREDFLLDYFRGRYGQA